MNNAETMKPQIIQKEAEKATSHERMVQIMDSDQIKEKMGKIDQRYTEKELEIKTFELALAAIENKKKEDHDHQVSSLPTSHAANYKKLTTIEESQKATKITELQNIISNLKKTIERSDQVSEKAQKAINKAQESWFGKIWSSVKKFGSDVIDGIKAIPSKIKEFVTSRKGKKILKYTALAVGIAALGALALWLIGAPLGSGSSELYKKGRDGLLKLLDKLGLGWKFPPGLEDTI